MNYPIWELWTIGGGSLIALIAVTHVYISHLAVGGGAFLWLTDWKGFRDSDPGIHNYVKKHTWFFLLLTMVFGGVSGVGIWFIISLVHPAATSKLIHAFVFGWAIEWVFFVGEIVALLIYHYYFDKLSRKERLIVAFLYFLFAWLSMVIINGILSFMLTPGAWIETKQFWDGFLNPSYFPSLVFRTAMSMIIAGIFGAITAVRINEEALRITLMKYVGKWMIIPFAVFIPAGAWYYYSLPASVRLVAFGQNPQNHPFVAVLLAGSVIVFSAGIATFFKTKRMTQKIFVYLIMFIGLFWMGGFEYSREISRKPFVIYNYMYSNGIMASEIEKLNEKGILNTARWTPMRSISQKNHISAGREIFNLECLACHTLNGFRNDIMDHVTDLTYTGKIAALTGQGKVFGYMPPFAGTRAEKESLAAWLTQSIQKRKIVTSPVLMNIQPLKEVMLPEFDKKKAEYILLTWNNFGMNLMSDFDRWFAMLPPANTLEAQLIKRGPVPELVTDGVELTYRVEPGFENPVQYVEFWKYAESTFGVKLEENIGLAGNGLNGVMKISDETGDFIAKWIPVVPHKDDGSYNPYPVFTVTAKDKTSGEILAQSKSVVPVSSSLSCYRCHAGDDSVQDMDKIRENTARNILKVHDKHNGTRLLELAAAGKPQLCQSCHADPVLAAPGKESVLNFSAAIHGFHANYMPVEGAEACAMCHPSGSNGDTRCNRGIHNRLNITCVECHGTLKQHAIGLLNYEKSKKAAQILLANLHVNHSKKKQEINPRKPWANEPDCLNCHEDFQKPGAPFSGFNQWTTDENELYRMRHDDAGVRCIGCHGSMHAVFPASNSYNQNRDNLIPLQYSGMPTPVGSNKSCEICHTQKMEDPIHHENMDRLFRNTQVLK